MILNNIFFQVEKFKDEEYRYGRPKYLLSYGRMGNVMEYGIYEKEN